MTSSSIPETIHLEPVSADSIPAQKEVYVALAELHPKAILTEVAMAKAFGVSGRTVRRMVQRYELPPATTIGGKSTWFAGRVLAWLESRAERQEKQVSQIISKINAFNH